MNPQTDLDSQSSVMLPEAPVPQRRVPGLHRALAQIEFPRRRWLHVTLLPALIFAALLGATDLLLGAWAAALNRGIAVLGLHGVVAVRPLSWADLLESRLVVADVPAAAPTSEQVWVGALLVAALWLMSMLIRTERTPLRYALRALLLCEGAALVYFGPLEGVLPYTLGDHVAPGIVVAWIFMLLVPWLHAANFNIFGFGLWRKLALTLLTLMALALLVPLQYLFHIAVIQPYSLLHLPALYLFAGVLLEVLVFVSLYAWAMSWQAVERER